MNIYVIIYGTWSLIVNFNILAEKTGFHIMLHADLDLRYEFNLECMIRKAHCSMSVFLHEWVITSGVS